MKAIRRLPKNVLQVRTKKVRKALFCVEGLGTMLALQS
jgi:hypothetical protein